MMTGETEGSVGPRIVRGRVDSLSLYEVTDFELQRLEEGLPGSVYLTFGVFSLSVSLSFLVALITASPAEIRVFTVFVVVTAIGALAGVVLLVLWFKTRTSVRAVLKRIRDRCVPDGGAVPAAPEQPMEETEASGT